MLHLTRCFSYGCCLLLPLLLQAQDGKNLQDAYRLEIGRTDSPIRIDGILDEPIWSLVDTAGDFWLSFPVDDRRVEKEFQTEVMMCYDDQFIYLAAVCYGAGPYVIQSLKRDNQNFWMGDAFAVVFDPVNERTAGVTFGTNPGNVQTESLVSGQTGRRGNNPSSSGINRAWDNKWFSKVKTYPDRYIVEMAIPFKTVRYTEKSAWGLNFIRSHSRTNTFHTWSPVPVQFRGVDLGYTGALIWNEKPAKAGGNVAVIPYALVSSFKDSESPTESENKARAGVDAKIAISSTLNLDITVNPDFSQVDVDEQVTNLTTVNIRFPERRLFFLENSDIFENFGIPPMRPFFSRRIGLDEDGQTIPISFGARLSGNLNKDLRIGVMTMQTKELQQTPGENYSSAAFQQRVFGRSTIKGFFHNRQRYQNGEFNFGNYNRVGGLELDYRSMDGKLLSLAGYGKSWVPGKDGNNSFYNLALGYEGRHISAYSNLAGVGDHYVADMGFIPRTFHYDAVRDTTFSLGFDHWFSRFAYTFYPQERKVNSRELGFRNILDITRDGQLIGNETEFSFTTFWRNTSILVMQLASNNAQLLFPFLFAENPLPAAKYHFLSGAVEFGSDQRKKLFYLVGLQGGGFYNGQRVQYSANINYRLQPWGNFGLNFVQNQLRFPDPYGSSSLFLIGPKIELAVSTDLTWTTFLQYNTQEDNFNINSRFQWRFQPLSEIFLVYSDNYAVELWGPKNRALILKINYWLNV